MFKMNGSKNQWHNFESIGEKKMQIKVYRIVEFPKLLFDLDGWELKQVNFQKP